MAKKYNHLHKYKRVDLAKHDGEYIVFKCQEAGCAHYVPKTIAEGKIGRCNKCNEPFALTKVSLNHKFPHCEACIKRPKADEIKDLGNLLDKLIT